MEKFIQEPARNIPIIDEADVLVVGGGPAGISAAVSAARNGARVVLLERYGHLGGMATGGLVILIPNLSYGTELPNITGMNLEWIERLKRYGGVLNPSKEEIKNCDVNSLEKWRVHLPYVWNKRYPHCAFVEPELLKLILNEMAEESKVNVYLHSWGCKVLLKGDSVNGVVFESKEGRQAVLGKIVIDATGDADIYTSAGGEFDIDSDKTLRNTMMGVVFRIGNVDFQKFGSFKLENPEAWNQHLANLHEIAGFRVLPTASARNDIVWVNNYVPGRNGLKVKDLTEVEFLVRKIMLPVLSYLQKEVPGFQNGFIFDTASQIGIRGSRRIRGEYKVTIEDLKNAKPHKDVIAVYPSINSNRPDYENILKPMINMPYRALVPQKIQNLLVAGRCFSSDVESNSLTNLIHNCVAMGEAAGAAAAIALNSNVQPRDVNITSLQTTLRKQGVYLP